MKSKIMKFFSDLGRSLMMPVAALAACGIILGITSALLKTQVQDAVPFLTASVPLFIITTLNKVSGIVFTLLPVLFAISIAFGLAKEDKGVAAFAGFIGYYTFLVASSCMISTGIMDFSAMKISNILGVDTVDMGALAGIMAGLVTAKLHNKYHKVQFPAAIAFYGGKRFVALVVLVSMTVIGLVMPLIWAPISVGIDGLGRIIRSSGAFGVFIFGTLERLLIPTGLHHVLNSLFRTTAIGGTYHGVEGCLNIFLQFLDQAPLSDMKPYTQFLGQGKMPYMLFGLPAAALAIYRTTPQDKKAKVKALMIAGVAACFVSGITEPLEFSFMFIAPALFVFHAIMGGISFMLMSLLGVIVGNTGGGFIDFLLWGVFQPGSHWYWVIVVGIPYGIPLHLSYEQEDEIFSNFAIQYPNIKYMARHVRYAHSGSENSLKAYLWYNGRTYESKMFTFTILDRVGGGDAFASGLIYAMMNNYEPMDIVNFAVASSAIKHTIRGDANITDDVESIKNLMNMNYDIKR